MCLWWFMLAFMILSFFGLLVYGCFCGFMWAVVILWFLWVHVGLCERISIYVGFCGFMLIYVGFVGLCGFM